MGAASRKTKGAISAAKLAQATLDGPQVTAKGIEARQRIIAVAESMFTRQGFDGTSMRDIATAANMQAASMYHHFPSKEELLWAVWAKGGIELLERVKKAIAIDADPWVRMQAACTAHIEGLLDWRRANQVLFVMPPWQYPEGIRDRVIALRDEYEAMFASLIEELPMTSRIDRHMFRLTLIGALSWSLYWYRAGAETPEMIATKMLQFVRYGADSRKR